MEQKKRIVVGVIGISTILVILGTTVAYFLTNPSNDNKEVLTIDTGSLSLIFDDNNDGMQIKALSIGESVSKELKIENNGTLPVTTNLNWKNLTNTYLTMSLSYKLEYKTTEDGEWAPVETVVGSNVPRSLEESEITLAKDLTIPNGIIHYYRLTITLENLDNVNQRGEINSYLGTKFSLGELKENSTFNVPDAVASVLSNEAPTGINATAPNLDLIATTDEGVFAIEDNYGTSYYFRGAVENNYVKFGGFYWRIIRINGDGSLRMIYDGIKTWSNGIDDANEERFININQYYNKTNNDNKYVGYMFGGSSRTAASKNAKEAQTNIYDSDIKTTVDKWYENNILKNVANSDKDLTEYLADAIFCNERVMPSNGETWWTNQASQPNLGWARNATPYRAFSRFRTTSNALKTTNLEATFICPDNTTTGLEQINKNNDRFTVNDTELGNGNLNYPVGLITGDEIVAAGSKSGTANKSYYLFKSNKYFTWSMTPDQYFGGASYSSSDYIVTINGALAGGGGTVHGLVGGIAPVINIKPEYTVTMRGSGTMDSPYQIPGIA